MLEDRLSKAYSQQNLGGYNLPPPRQAAGPYTSIPSQMPSNPAGAESFYTGQQRASYQAPQNQHYQKPPPHATPQPQYPSYGSAPEAQPGQYPPPQQVQRTDSWQNRAPSAPQDPYQQQQQQPQKPNDPNLQTQNPQQPQAPNASDPNASYYFTPQQPQQTPLGPSAPGSAPDANQSPYPNLQ